MVLLPFLFIRFTFWCNYNVVFLCAAMPFVRNNKKWNGIWKVGVERANERARKKTIDAKCVEKSTRSDILNSRMILFKCYIFSEKNDCFIAYIAALWKVNLPIYIYFTYTQPNSATKSARIVLKNTSLFHKWFTLRKGFGLAEKNEQQQQQQNLDKVRMLFCWVNCNLTPNLRLTSKYFGSHPKY